ncbi:hypothetical protein FB566_3153 [Stackebrandtia endophytica]|uniref:Peptidase MA superfamily protein n=2 Tax=Stackebrandtia endophytica TaxID=1496996 RepID=A0A543AYD2_9ACTN|nr:hypothetical protein FB566_3153 [Stackebrandtia endophytica]
MRPPGPAPAAPTFGTAPANVHMGQPNQPPGAPLNPYAPQQPGQPPLFAPPAPPQGNHGRSVAIFCVVFSLIVGLGAFTVGFAIDGGATGNIGAAAIPSPGPDDPPEVRAAYLSAKAQVALDDHSNALLIDDEAGWLEIFDDRLHDDMSQQFSSLRNLEVSQYDYTIQGDPREVNDGEWEFRLAVSYCFGGVIGEECADAAIVFDTVWEDASDGLIINQVEDSDEAGPRPWEVEDIRAVSGDKVIVATPAKYSDQLEEALPEAEAAAENADQYAVYGEVEKYIVYLAGNAEFSSWYGLDGASMDNVVGFAMPVPVLDDDGRLTSGGYEVVMHIDRVRDSLEFRSTMRHELGHVATLHHSGDHYPVPEDWWMVEGIAEVIDHDPSVGLEDYLRKRDVQAYVDQKLWNGELEAVYNSDDALTGSAKYGIAMYAVYYLFNEYGKDKFMDLFERVARNGEDAEAATQAAYGMSYDDLVAECADFIESLT